ncbi:Uncharacterized protein ALO51_04587 [Pseudomonas amygdali]|nr:Uncharacterized protein ALO51_04587 [Pseudomonas amygdali]
MSKPTDTSEFLNELNGGAFASQMGHALSEVAASVVNHGKAGKVVITLDFSQIGESSQVKIKHKLDYKVPTKRGTRSENTSLDTPKHVGSGGNITLFAEASHSDGCRRGQQGYQPCQSHRRRAHDHGQGLVGKRSQGQRNTCQP